MNRREALKSLAVLLAPSRAVEAEPLVSTLIGTGVAGFNDRQVKNPYGLDFGPDGALYFCDLAHPHGVLVDACGRLYVSDSEAHRIRVVSA